MNQIEFDSENINDLLPLISVNAQNNIIGIDGNCGTGKTTLSYKIAYELRGKIIDLDDFILEKPYSLDLSRIRRIIQNHPEKCTIISGVLLLKILEHLNLKSTYLIYCKEIDDDGRWPFSFNFDEYTTPNSLNIFSDFEKEIIDYTKNLEPHKKADFIVNLKSSTKHANKNARY